MKYVLVTGGVISGLGKGITASSVGYILKEAGLEVTAIKIDPYLNIDAGTMSPFEHGEVYVLDDGGEADLDLGNYERFLDIRMTRDHNITTGKVYEKVLRRERDGFYLGKTVQMIPHISDAIVEWIIEVAQVPVTYDRSQLTSDRAGDADVARKHGKVPDVCIIELGGTVGDIESSIFLEALRQLRFRVSDSNFCHMHCSLIVTVGKDNEQKSKPTQHSCKALMECGLMPDFIVCRLHSTHDITNNIRRKVSMFSGVSPNHVLSVPDMPTLYDVPLNLLRQGVGPLLLNKLHLNRVMTPSHLSLFEELSAKMRLLGLVPCERLSGARMGTGAITSTSDSFHCGDVSGSVTSASSVGPSAEVISHFSSRVRTVRIGIVGKYTGLSDSYLSLSKAVQTASLHCDVKLEIVWIEAEDLLMPSETKQLIGTHDYDSPRKNQFDTSQHQSTAMIRGGVGEGVSYVGNDDDEDPPTKITEDDGSAISDRGSGDDRESSVTGKSGSAASMDDSPVMVSDETIASSTPFETKIVAGGSDWTDFLDSMESLSMLMEPDCRIKCEEAWKKLRSVDGILVPGGFGSRGVEGKIQAINFARTRKIPFFGICLGLQCAVIEFARNVCGLTKANSEEFISLAGSTADEERRADCGADLLTEKKLKNAAVKEEEKKDETKRVMLESDDKRKTPPLKSTLIGKHSSQMTNDDSSMTPAKVVIFMPEIDKQRMGGNMRLGLRPCRINRADCIAYKLYGKRQYIYERHRHRYEVNPEYVGLLSESGLRFTGTDIREERMEIVELNSDDHPFFFAVQFHPEFLSNPRNASPPFVGFVKASARNAKKKKDRARTK